MTNLALKTLNVVPCYYQHTMRMMWEALNTTSLSICRTMCESDHLLVHSISNVLSCCKPPTTYWFLNLGNEIKVIGSNQIQCGIPSHFLPRRTAILMKAGCSKRVTSISHDTHQLTDFTALAVLLPAIKKPYVA
ncbi:uncharacterized protein TNCV_2034101 [Trichonephila clavipes]|nr:uncharacterized protein TNCV_2034101 [Trichonephila clavipes]